MSEKQLAPPTDPTPPLPLGKIEIAPNAIATIASQAVMRSYGVVGMAAKNVVDGIANALTNDPHKGIEVHQSPDGEVRLNIYVIIEYGTNLNSVARSVANTVRYNIERLTGLDVRGVTVHVQGLRITSTD